MDSPTSSTSVSSKADSTPRPRTFNNQGRHIAWIIGRALACGATAVEPSLEAQNAYVDHVREVSIDTSAFIRECTPGYFNNEGQEVADENGEPRPRFYAGETYGLGYYAFEELLAGWRANDDLAGLVIDN